MSLAVLSGLIVTASPWFILLARAPFLVGKAQAEERNTHLLAEAFENSVSKAWPF